MTKEQKPQSQFNRNIVSLMTGTTIAQAIPVAISPILTRIYTPEDFGFLAIFMAITAVFGSIVTGRYELAIMLPEKDEDAINIFALGFVIAVAISLLLLLLVVVFHEDIVVYFKNESMGVWLYFIPLAVFFTGLFNLLNYFNNRKSYYKDIANAYIVKSIVMVIIQLSMGFLKQGVAGLVTGQIISQVFANMRLLRNVTKNKVLLSEISKVKIKKLAKRYINFPVFSTWSILANTLSVHLINILIPIFFNMATLGFYSLVQRLLGMPSILIGSAISQVFFHEATKEKQETGKAIKTFNSTVKKLLILGVPAFGLLFFVVEDLFVFVFGIEWKEAGKYAQILIPLFFIRFIVSTVTAVDAVMEKQNVFLLFNIILLSASVTIMLASASLGFEVFLMNYLYGVGFIYVVYGFVLYKMAKNELGSFFDKAPDEKSK